MRYTPGPWHQGYHVGDTVLFSSLGAHHKGEVQRFSKENGVWKVVVKCGNVQYYLKVSDIQKEK